MATRQCNNKRSGPQTRKISSVDFMKLQVRRKVTNTYCADNPVVEGNPVKEVEPPSLVPTN